MIKKTAVLLFVLFSVLYVAAPASAMTQQERNFLLMYFKPGELKVVSTTRGLKSVSRVAENVEVVTAEDIEMMDAHTLADVLYFIPGVELDIRGGPGSGAVVFIQGAETRNVLVLIDGVEWNNLSDSFADVGAIPVQDIERVEIIKGPASSSWGSSLGGVINVITKPAGDSKAAGGVLSASYGERNTGDYRAEISGRVKDLGYYLYAGNLVTDGLVPNTHFRENNIYTKFQWDVTDKARLLWTLGYDKGPRGSGEAPEIGMALDGSFEYLFSTLALNYEISQNAGVDVSTRMIRRSIDQSEETLDTGEVVDENAVDDSGYGGSIKLNLKNDMHRAVLGFDYDNGELRSDSILDGRQRLEKWAVFANDSMRLGRFSVTPGLRYDHTNTNGDFVSPSLGVTYRLGEKTVLRGYIARGFSIPPLAATFATGFFSVPNPDLKMEKVWSYQVGVESSVLTFLWVKTTLFRHDVRDAIVTEQMPDGTFEAVNQAKQRRQGVELEVRTAPVYHTSISAGLVFIDAEDRETGETLRDIPRYTYDIGVQYDDKRTFKALLKGHYIWWNESAGSDGEYNDFIWDLNLMKKVYTGRKMEAELFATGHNIFNGSQYTIGDFKNPSRWIEGGLRIKFL